MAKILNISGAEFKDRGIQKLADYVEANLPDEFSLVIGCKPSIYDVDAVLIGRGNIYAIECKDWKGNVKGGSYGWWQKDGQVIESPLHQARNNAVALGKWLRDKIKRKDIWVQGLVVFTHENGELHIDIDQKSNTAISVINLERLKDWISNRDSTFKNFEFEKKIVTLFMTHAKKKEKVSDEVMLHVITIIAVLAFIIVMFILSSKLGAISLFAAFLVLPLLRRFQQDKIREAADSEKVADDAKVKRISTKYKYSDSNEFDESESIVTNPIFRNFASNIFHKDSDMEK